MINDPYTDKTSMYFGMHKGKLLGNIPASYFIYLWENSKDGKDMYDKKLAAYIKDNLQGLKMEAIAEKQRKRYERR